MLLRQINPEILPFGDVGHVRKIAGLGAVSQPMNLAAPVKRIVDSGWWLKAISLRLPIEYPATHQGFFLALADR
jgi:hypothetical protein